MKRVAIFLTIACLFIGSAWGQVKPVWGLVLRVTGGSSATPRPAFPSTLDTSSALAPGIGAYLFNNGVGYYAHNYALHADSECLTNATADDGLWDADGILFDANYEHVKGFDMSELDGSGSIVFSYKKTSTPTNYYYWFVQDDDYTAFSVNIDPAGGTSAHDYQIGGSNQSFADATSFLDGGWHQMVYTWDDSAGTRSWYMDGALKQTISGAFTWGGTAGDYFRIGGRPTGLGRFAGGVFGYFYVYSSVLSSSQVSSLYSDPYQMWKSCNTEALDDSPQYLTYSEQLGDTSDRMWVASRFQAPSSATICKVRVKFYSNIGVPDRTIWVAIFDDNSGEPGSIVGNWSTPRNASEVAAADDTLEFSDLGAGLSGAATYWLVAKISGAADASNHPRIELGTGDPNRLLMKGDGSGAWVSEGSYNLNFWLYE